MTNDPVQWLNDKTSVALRYQNALGYALPPIIPLRDTVVVKQGESVESNIDLKRRLQSGLKAIASVNYQMPVTLRSRNSTETSLMLPVDPVISLGVKNIIKRRYVAKHSGGGSIKERWSRDDWDITISGLLTDDDVNSAAEYAAWLQQLCTESKQGLSIECEILNSYIGIQYIAVESLDLPFTKGMENQVFVIKGYSDDDQDLLIKK